MTYIVAETRRAERFSTSLAARVKGRENQDTLWKEDTTLITVSRIGASFYLQRKCSVGLLVSVLFQMPKHLRVYDKDEVNYRIWGLVQHCNSMSDDENAPYHTGIAFIGKTAPPSYHENTRQYYRISGISENGLWKVAETAAPFVTRKDTRFPAALEVSLRMFHQKIIIAEEKTLTENISFGGAAVLSNLGAEIGEEILFTCEKYNFSTPAIVRSRSFNEKSSVNKEDKYAKLHLEFMDGRFPLEEVEEI